MSGLNGNEVLYVIGKQNGGYAAETEQTTTGAIAALGGGTAAGPVTPVDTGTTYTSLATDSFIVWDTSTPGTKITYINTNVMNDGQVLIVKDYGAGAYSQTIQSLNGIATVEKAASYVFDPANGASVNLKWDFDENNLIIW